LPPADTSQDAWDVARESWARLGPEGRLRAAFEASEFIRDVAREEIRARNPDYDEEKVARELFRRIYGAALFERVYCGRGESS